MTVRERFGAAREIVADIEKLSREALAATGSEPLGERAIWSQDPHERPRPRASKRSPAPVAHAATVATWLAMKIAYREFVFVYREAVERFKERAEADFPAGCFPPRAPFVARAGPAWT